MALRRTFAVAAAFALAATLAAPEPELVAPAAAQEKKLPSLKVHIDKQTVDLEKGRLIVQMSRKPSHVEIKVYGEDGSVIASETHDFKGKSAGAKLKVTWNKSDEKVAKIEVFGHDVHGYYAGVRIVPWSLWIPHEEVNFETNSAKVRSSEAPKLADSLETIQKALKKHGSLGPITLYVAGHTDTVGKPAHNMDLSRRRARSIASWFRRHGLKIPVAYAGFGESALLVKTKDEVDEIKNRRVDYVLSVEEPRFKNSDRRPAWKRL